MEKLENDIRGIGQPTIAMIYVTARTGNKRDTKRWRRRSKVQARFLLYIFFLRYLNHAVSWVFLY